MMRTLPVIGFVVLIVWACSNDPVLSPNYEPGWQPPVVTGIELMNETALRIGIWGNPDFPEDVIDPNPPGNGPITLLQMSTPFPNPADGNFIIQFSISRSSEIKIWINPARWINETFISYPAGIGGTFVDAEGGRAIEVLVDGSQEHSPGVYEDVFENRSEDGERQVPQGFYRVYVQANEVTLWRDIYVGYFCQGAPPGLRRYLHYCPDR